jgi:UDP-N-acetylglucosamine diphosphorylase / glucose-1-phosphate thymidylyltransferase / UDP-N-acetylgalactosamine diphosphorylase / glucosamine-1-phosphate N-acetyltransferase / galactosamine-1-phosphate N-acetyltransferase
MRRMIIFDDGRGRFGPMTDLRASFELRTGMLTTAERIAAQRPKTLAAYWVPPRLQALLAERADAPVNEFPTDDAAFHLVNGRWSIPYAVPHLAEGQALVEEESGDVVEAVMRRDEAEYFLQSGTLHERMVQRPLAERVLYRSPWDILAVAWKTITSDILATRVLDAVVPPSGVVTVGENPVEIHESARIFPNAVFDATMGPIVVQERAVVRPGAVLCGPCSIGADTVIADHALIKPNTAIGPCCRVGGEVGATIFQGFSNKAHDGHLGDSWVGEWVNFGAGTTNSNLLNTYGEVAMRIDPDGPRQRTGLTFLGTIVGDHAKFAIGTRIMTGTVIGTGGMIASTAPPPASTRRFAWITDEGERAYRFDKFMEVAKAMMARRRREPSAAYTAALRELHERAVRAQPGSARDARD